MAFTEQCFLRAPAHPLRIRREISVFVEEIWVLNTSYIYNGSQNGGWAPNFIIKTGENAFAFTEHCFLRAPAHPLRIRREISVFVEEI